MQAPLGTGVAAAATVGAGLGVAPAVGDRAGVSVGDAVASAGATLIAIVAGLYG